MESLLKLSGLLGEEDDRTDLGTLEKRLADKAMSNQQSSANGSQTKSPGRSDSVSHNSAQDTHQTTPQPDQRSSTKSTGASPPQEKKNEEEVEVLSDMMCSLVTNNNGETKYIGKISVSNFSM